MLWLGFGLMALLALGFLGAVFFTGDARQHDKTRSPQGSSQSNIDIFRERELELDAQLAEGQIDAQQHRALLVEAQRCLLEDVVETDVAETGAVKARALAHQRSGSWVLVASAVLVLVVSFVGYHYLGAAADLDIKSGLETVNDDTRPALAEKIRLRLNKHPDNLVYWVLLARLYHQDGKSVLSQKAYEEALSLDPEDLTIRSEYAQILFLAAGNTVSGEVSAQLQDILRVDSNQPSALGLRGIGAYALGDYQAALDDWNRALNYLPPGSDSANAMRAGMASARARLKAAGGGDASDGGEAEVSGSSYSGSGIKVSISLTDGLKAAPETLLFVYIREWQGSRMPIMARRLKVADLPLVLEFRNEQALMPGRDFSSVSRLEIVARVAHGGTPMPASGDYQGRFGPIALGKEFSADGDMPIFSVSIDSRLP